MSDAGSVAASAVSSGVTSSVSTGVPTLRLQKKWPNNFLPVEKPTIEHCCTSRLNYLPGMEPGTVVPASAENKSMLLKMLEHERGKLIRHAKSCLKDIYVAEAQELGMKTGEGRKVTSIKEIKSVYKSDDTKEMRELVFNVIYKQFQDGTKMKKIVEDYKRQENIDETNPDGKGGTMIKICTEVHNNMRRMFHKIGDAYHHKSIKMRREQSTKNGKAIRNGYRPPFYDDSIYCVATSNGNESAAQSRAETSDEKVSVLR